MLDEREKRLAYQREYRLINKDKILSYGKKYYYKNKYKIYERHRKDAKAWKARNPERVKEWQNKWSAKNRELRKQQKNLRLYGITQKERESILQSQGHRCIICRTENPGKKGWQTDHCHKTNKVRGFLCANCNLLLGNARESVAILKAAIKYLRLHTTS